MQRTLTCRDIRVGRLFSNFVSEIEQPSKRVLITGASIGIGRATSLAFAREGYHVVATDILESNLADVVRSIRSQGGSAEGHVLDVRSTEDCEKLLQSIHRTGPLDSIVLNAGVARKVPIKQLTDAKWDETFDIDLKGMIRVIRPTVDAMKECRKKGSIICITSLMGLSYGWSEHVHYSSAKAGVIGMMRALAVELAGSNIRVNAIAPGYIRTAQLLDPINSLGPEEAEKAGEFIPMGRIGEPEEIADVALFLA